ncbi:MAG: iron-siderophore ABC transporter substrate-binding protein [Cyanosarcina radialis HA8281-LM2]|jgi:iron complex transport system substrate-binding protein|nr:iron-siderophore ABC transporter substrate-binding protein [Cyanosarcina radialis HA8281-LM2]
MNVKKYLIILNPVSKTRFNLSSLRLPSPSLGEGLGVRAEFRIYRVIKPLLLMTLSFLLTTACYSPVIHKPNLSIARAPDCRVVQHLLGEVCIPVEPKRIVALDSTGIVDPLLAIGIRPIGMASHHLEEKEDLAGLIPDEVEGIIRVGDVYSPSLERILKLKPDLILGTFFHEQIYQQLSAIAPTVLLQEHQDNPIKKYLRYLGQILNQEVEAEKVLSQYQARIAKLREKLNRQPQEIEVTVLEHHTGSFFLPGTSDAPHEIFADIGLIDNIAVSDDKRQVSIEVLHKYDADILFFMDYVGKPKSFLLQNPLIASLNAVKNDRAYFVETSKWHTGGILGLNRILDDIFVKRYLEVVPKNS